MRRQRPVTMTARPRVSVVVPCYNYGHFLPAAVRSATDQPGVEVDVLIVDDASPDGSGDVARDLAAADPRVKVLQHEVNAGHLRTYNDGLRAVTGDYVVLLSADDMLAPGSLGRSTALLEANPGVGLAYGFAQSFQTQPRPARTKVRNWSIWSGSEWAEVLCRRGGTAIVNPEAVMRKQLLDNLDYYDLALPMTADMDMWLRAAQRAEVGRVNGPDQAFYRVHGANMHLNQFAGVITDVRARLDTLSRLYLNRGPAEHRLYDLGAQAIAREALDIAAAAHDQGAVSTVPVPDFVDAAREAWPGIVHTAGWRRFERRRLRADPSSWMRWADQQRTLRHKIRWRRWRRYGV